ncbi:MAG: response regulator [Melioribacteraceae bacterium]|nr:response regulator [Melioribacteraceae bacterium]
MENVKKILLVDDDIDLLEQNKTLLESKGFKIITAESAEDGFKVFEKEKPDAAIIDLIMEQMDSGFILCYKIKKTDHGKKIPVFMLTSATYETGFKFSASSKEEKEWIKCDGILNKPVVVEELISKLENFSYH